MTVAANVKQCLSIILGVWVFRLHVSWMNALGIIIALGGGAWYAKVEFGAKMYQQWADLNKDKGRSVEAHQNEMV